MRKTLLTLFSFSLVALLTAADQKNGDVFDNGAIFKRHELNELVEPNTVVVKFKNLDIASIQAKGISPQKFKEDRFSNALKATGGEGRVLKTSHETQFGVIRTEHEDIASVIQTLSKREDVEYAQPNFIYRKSAVPNDPEYNRQWGLKNTAQTIANTHLSESIYTTNNAGLANRDMGFEAAWDKVTDCSNVVVAVIDTGIKLDHDDIAPNLWEDPIAPGVHGRDTVNGDNDPTDDEGHGTHVAGTIGARGNNAIGTTGACWQVKLMGVKVLGADGSGTTVSIIEGIEYAVDKNAHILNMSLGGGGALDPAFRDAVRAASDAGALLVVAAGNEGRNNGSTATYPCNFSAANLICVGAVDQRFSIASFSNFSPIHVDIGAPGTNIISTDVGDRVSRLPTTWITSTLGLGSGFAINGPDYILQNPSNWNGVNRYANSANDRAYTNARFDLNDLEFVQLGVGINGSVEEDYDFLDFFASPSVANPIGAAYLGTVTGSTGGRAVKGTFSARVCNASATCSVGLEFSSDTDTDDIGYRITELYMEGVLTGSTTGSYAMNGTSMATPHVAGLAALIKAHNPSFTASDLRSAILTTGTTISTLSSRFATSAVANAPNALNFIPALHSVTAEVVPDSASKTAAPNAVP
jgi:subtilisin family serine protease